MSQLRYEPSVGGGPIELDGDGAHVGVAAELRSRSWAHELTKNDVTALARRSRSVKLEFVGSFEAADRLRRAADLDLEARQPGQMVAQGEWRQRAYVTAQEVDNAAFGNVFASLEVALLDGAWWRTVEVPFVITEDIDGGAFLDFPHGYEFDFGRPAVSQSVDVAASVSCPVLLTVYGPAFNPYVIVGANRYQVNVTVPDGSRLVVDGMAKRITMIARDGAETDCFGSGVRSTGEGGGAYVFEKLKPGEQQVAWDNSFGFDLGWYEFESEPPWTR